MRNTLVRLLGWRGLLLYDDAIMFDRWLWLRRHLGRGPVRTLDAGSGSGAFTLYASVAGNEAVGISFDDRKNQTARARSKILNQARVQFITCDLRRLSELAPSLGSFDQIMCLETIEHVRDDAKLMRDLAAVLRPGGQLLLTTPFSGHPGLLGDRVSVSEDGGHIRRGYTHEELRELMNDAGLDITWQGYIGAITSQALTNVQRWISRGNWFLAWMVILPLRTVRALEPLVKRIHHGPLLSVAVVATKRG
jgi:SAM-dependent methyltransferase